jgi:hypothetical protein
MNIEKIRDYVERHNILALDYEFRERMTRTNIYLGERIQKVRHDNPTMNEIDVWRRVGQVATEITKHQIVWRFYVDPTAKASLFYREATYAIIKQEDEEIDKILLGARGEG